MSEKIESCKITIGDNASPIQKLIVSWYNVKIAFVCSFCKNDRRLRLIAKLTKECINRLV